MTPRVVRPLITKPVPGPASESNSRESWRLHGAVDAQDTEGSVPAARCECAAAAAVAVEPDPAKCGPVRPSVVMPTTMTELSELLAGDDTVCVRRPSQRSGDTSAASATAPAQGMGDAESASPTGRERVAGPVLASLPSLDIDAEAELAEVIDVWPLLPRSVHTAILAIIDATLDPQDAGRGGR